ncbi:hypothetical protein HYV79_01480 [Candidatus Woesearchaeota archaeon]|nr:hypothetical protein [Candidatus Woesearchaeota archaeon]
MDNSDDVNLFSIKEICDLFINIEHTAQEYLNKQTADNIEKRISQIAKDKRIEPANWFPLPENYTLKKTCTTKKLIAKQYKDGVELMYTRRFNIPLQILEVTFEVIDYSKKLVYHYKLHF